MAADTDRMLLTIPARKAVRAKVVADYMRSAGYARAVCFSCGNASAALAAAGVDVVDVSPTGGLRAMRWWTPAEIRRTWPDALDATSGHLPVHLLETLGHALLDHLRHQGIGLGRYTGLVDVPTGSGETLCALALAAPHLRLVAVYGAKGREAATCWHQEAPLRALVKRLAHCVHGEPADPRPTTFHPVPQGHPEE